MEKLVVKGPTPLKGEVTINGAKNAAVALLPATLLIDGCCTIENLPNISDIKISCEILEKLGAKITWNNKNSVTIDSTKITCDITYRAHYSYSPRKYNVVWKNYDSSIDEIMKKIFRNLIVVLLKLNEKDECLKYCNKFLRLYYIFRFI